LPAVTLFALALRATLVSILVSRALALGAVRDPDRAGLGLVCPDHDPRSGRACVPIAI
jgi:hypothetical protein